MHIASTTFQESYMQHLGLKLTSSGGKEVKPSSTGWKSSQLHREGIKPSQAPREGRRPSQYPWEGRNPSQTPREGKPSQKKLAQTGASQIHRRNSEFFK